MTSYLRHFKSNRKFSLFSYGSNHGLLLRSGRTDRHHTRIDVLILDVRAMKSDHGSTVVEINAGEIKDYLQISAAARLK